MTSTAEQVAFTVTREELEGFIRRIVEVAHPVEVIAFGSRARGEHRPDSDLDIAVLVEDPAESERRMLWGVTEGFPLPVDILIFSKDRYDRFRPWINTVQREIDREGVRLYVRGEQPTDRSVFERLC